MCSRKADEKREEILRTARKIIHQKGYHGTKMQDIADAVGMYKGSLYHHVDKKEDIILEIINDGLTNIIDGLEESCTASSTYEGKLKAAIRYHIRHTAHNTDTLAVLLENTKHLPPEHQAPIIEQQHRYENVFIDILEKGIEAGEFKPVDVKIVAFGILGMCNWVYRWYSADGRRTADEIADIYFQFAMSGLRRDERNDIKCSSASP